MILHQISILMKKELTTAERLAIERTKLANERTFLAYFRTFLVFFSSGIAIIKLPSLSRISFIGYALLAIAPLLLFIGIHRFYRTRRNLRQFYKDRPS